MGGGKDPVLEHGSTACLHHLEPPPFSHQDLFAPEIVAPHIGDGSRVVFISDVRSGDPSILTHEVSLTACTVFRCMSWVECQTSPFFFFRQQMEEAVKVDMARQMGWHLEMKPVASMLKFRLPYSAGISSYLDGERMVPGSKQCHHFLCVAPYRRNLPAHLGSSYHQREPLDSPR